MADQVLSRSEFAKAVAILTHATGIFECLPLEQIELTAKAMREELLAGGGALNERVRYARLGELARLANQMQDAAAEAVHLATAARYDRIAALAAEEEFPEDADLADVIPLFGVPDAAS